MLPEPADAALLYDMLISARRVLAYATNRTRQDLNSDTMFADAVERRIEIIGEAARGVSNACKQSNAEIPWRAITATRNILAQDYDEVNHDIVWRIVIDHLPPLVEALERLVPDDASDNS